MKAKREEYYFTGSEEGNQGEITRIPPVSLNFSGS
jgi:hypothetical protein